MTAPVPSWPLRDVEHFVKRAGGPATAHSGDPFAAPPWRQRSAASQELAGPTTAAVTRREGIVRGLDDW